MSESSRWRRPTGCAGISPSGTPPIGGSGSPGRVVFSSIPPHWSWEVGILFSQALAFNGTPGTGSSGGAIALSIILVVAITLLLVYVAQKKWRRHRLSMRDAGGE